MNFSMEAVCTALLGLLETTFVFAAFLILHGLKRLVGSSPLYMSFGVLLVCAHFLAAAGLAIVIADWGINIGIANSLLMLPCLALLLIVYAADGTLAAQRMIIGAMAAFGMFAYLSRISVIQCDWSGFTVSQGILSDFLAKLMKSTNRTMAASMVSLTLDLFLIPMVFQRFKNYGCRLGICTLAALIFGQFLDSFSYHVILQGWNNYLFVLKGQFLPNLLITAWLSILASYYISRIDRENPGGSRRALDIFLAFFGSYGKAKLLEQNLRESEQRYRTLIQNAEDLIMITDANGTVVDANRSALNVFSLSAISDIIGCTFEELTGTGLPDASAQQPSVLHVDVPEKKLKLELSVNRITFEGTPAIVFIGRDITERERLTRERENWRMENMHRQRLEAIGRLAGGIAHDFNNHLHAITGHLDLIYMDKVSEESVRHLEKIDAIVQQAGKLTGQLLGYARKGRRQIEKIELNSLVHSAMDLFMPNTQTGISFELRLTKERFFIEGDKTQLQQALLNLMINAKDAMAEKPEPERIMNLSSGTPESLGITPEKPMELKKRTVQYCCIAVEDRGSGVKAELQEKIFEPFFTTKPIGQGTGMGLSMSQGVMLEHNGWIQYHPAAHGGAEFVIFLPVVNEENPS